jgi:hypothetical protein
MDIATTARHYEQGGLGLWPRFVFDGMMYVWWRAGELFVLVFFLWVAGRVDLMGFMF